MTTKNDATKRGNRRNAGKRQRSPDCTLGSYYNNDVKKWLVGKGRRKRYWKVLLVMVYWRESDSLLWMGFETGYCLMDISVKHLRLFTVTFLLKPPSRFCFVCLQICVKSWPACWFQVVKAFGTALESHYDQSIGNSSIDFMHISEDITRMSSLMQCQFPCVPSPHWILALCWFSDKKTVILTHQLMSTCKMISYQMWMTPGPQYVQQKLPLWSRRKQLLSDATYLFLFSLHH